MGFHLNILYINTYIRRATHLDTVAGSGVDVNGVEGSLNRRLDSLALVVVNGGLSSLGDTLGIELKGIVDLLEGSRSTESVQTKLLVRVSRPAKVGVDLDGKHGDAIGENRLSVLERLLLEGEPVGQRDDTGSDTLLLLEELGGSNTDGNLRTSGHKVDVTLVLGDELVTTLGGLLDGRALKLRQVLSGQRQDRGSVVVGDGLVVSSGGLVTVGRSPHRGWGVARSQATVSMG